MLNVGKYTIHGWYGLDFGVFVSFLVCASCSYPLFPRLSFQLSQDDGLGETSGKPRSPAGQTDLGEDVEAAPPNMDPTKNTTKKPKNVASVEGKSPKVGELV